MKEQIERLTNELTEFIYQADKEMIAEEMAKTIANAIKKAARNNDLSERPYFYNWVSYFVQP